MKKIKIICMSGLLFFAACENTGSSTVGTYEKDETSQTLQKSEGESHSAELKEHSSNSTADTIRASGDATNERSGTEIKTSENVPADTAKSKVDKKP